MTDSNIIENKKLVDSAIDMLSNVVKIDREKVLIKARVRIDELQEMSIDLLSIAAFGTNDAIDMLCKFNGIENPLSIKAGDIINIPDLNSLMSNTKILVYSSMMLEKQKNQILKTTIKSTQNSPSKKTIETKSVVKTSDGILIF